MHTVVITCAGDSTRFPGMRPKWSLTHPTGNLMAVEALRGLQWEGRLVVAVQRPHADAYGAGHIARESALGGYPQAEVTVIEPTASQVATVRAALGAADVRGALTVKDCDNQLAYAPGNENAVAVVDLHELRHITPGNKSYVRVDGAAMVQECAERTILSPLFCCGAYTFDSVVTFDAYAPPQATYLSAVVHGATALRNVHARRASGYQDWGTAHDWAAYCGTFATLFVDVDGVLTYASHRSFVPRWGATAHIGANVAHLQALHATGRVHVVLTTARPEALRAETERQLVGVPHHALLMGLPNAARYVINDMVRGKRTAHAVNIERDAPVLAQLLRIE